MVRRERWSVIGDILSAIQNERSRGMAPRISNVAARANVAYDRLDPYLAELESAGLIMRDSAFPEVTAKGHEFLRHYRTWTAVLDDFGLS
ncbi:MAG TPA: winged helix-turn-helix domain-containing protein [Candidatus Thermoplasmatota archaeon]|nr:winged helix-turn-helix domain-containing protein [Candidatus Thermoplasmatota archaeon]